ncbi:MAG: hypothetical protein RIS24_71 [Verrucomicrobiota bacterium]
MASSANWGFAFVGFEQKGVSRKIVRNLEQVFEKVEKLQQI